MPKKQNPSNVRFIPAEIHAAIHELDTYLADKTHTNEKKNRIIRNARYVLAHIPETALAAEKQRIALRALQNAKAKFEEAHGVMLRTPDGIKCLDTGISAVSRMAIPSSHASASVHHTPVFAYSTPSASSSTTIDAPPFRNEQVKNAWIALKEYLDNPKHTNEDKNRIIADAQHKLAQAAGSAFEEQEALCTLMDAYPLFQAVDPGALKSDGLTLLGEHIAEINKIAPFSTDVLSRFKTVAGFMTYFESHKKSIFSYGPPLVVLEKMLSQIIQVHYNEKYVDAWSKSQADEQARLKIIESVFDVTIDPTTRKITSLTFRSHNATESEDIEKKIERVQTLAKLLNTDKAETTVSYDTSTLALLLNSIVMQYRLSTVPSQQQQLVHVAENLELHSIKADSYAKYSTVIAKQQQANEDRATKNLQDTQKLKNALTPLSDNLRKQGKQVKTQLAAANASVTSITENTNRSEELNRQLAVQDQQLANLKRQQSIIEAKTSSRYAAARELASGPIQSLSDDFHNAGVDIAEKARNESKSATDKKRLANAAEHAMTISQEMEKMQSALFTLGEDLGQVQTPVSEGASILGTLAETLATQQQKAQEIRKTSDAYSSAVTTLGTISTEMTTTWPDTVTELTKTLDTIATQEQEVIQSYQQAQETTRECQQGFTALSQAQTETAVLALAYKTTLENISVPGTPLSEIDKSSDEATYSRIAQAKSLAELEAIFDDDKVKASIANALDCKLAVFLMHKMVEISNETTVYLTPQSDIFSENYSYYCHVTGMFCRIAETLAVYVPNRPASPLAMTLLRVITHVQEGRMRNATAYDQTLTEKLEALKDQAKKLEEKTKQAFINVQESSEQEKNVGATLTGFEGSIRQLQTSVNNANSRLTVLKQEMDSHEQKLITAQLTLMAEQEKLSADLQEKQKKLADNSRIISELNEKTNAFIASSKETLKKAIEHLRGISSNNGANDSVRFGLLHGEHKLDQVNHIQLMKDNINKITDIFEKLQSLELNDTDKREFQSLMAEFNQGLQQVIEANHIYEQEQEALARAREEEQRKAVPILSEAAGYMGNALGATSEILDEAKETAQKMLERSEENQQTNESIAQGIQTLQEGANEQNEGMQPESLLQKPEKQSLGSLSAYLNEVRNDPRKDYTTQINELLLNFVYFMENHGIEKDKQIEQIHAVLNALIPVIAKHYINATDADSKNKVNALRNAITRHIVDTRQVDIGSCVIAIVEACKIQRGFKLFGTITKKDNYESMVALRDHGAETVKNSVLQAAGALVKKHATPVPSILAAAARGQSDSVRSPRQPEPSQSGAGYRRN